jgi:hypothetical protein
LRYCVATVEKLKGFQRMPEERDSSNWVIVFAIVALVLALVIWNPLMIFVILGSVLGTLLFAAAVMKRRPMKDQSFPILPDEIEGRVLDHFVPGLGNWYLRLACMGVALVFYGMAVLALYEVVKYGGEY